MYRVTRERDVIRAEINARQQQINVLRAAVNARQAEINRLHNKLAYVKAQQTEHGEPKINYITGISNYTLLKRLFAKIKDNDANDQVKEIINIISNFEHVRNHYGYTTHEHGDLYKQIVSLIAPFCIIYLYDYLANHKNPTELKNMLYAVQHALDKGISQSTPENNLVLDTYASIYHVDPQKLIGEVNSNSHKPDIFSGGSKRSFIFLAISLVAIIIIVILLVIYKTDSPKPTVLNEVINNEYVSDEVKKVLVDNIINESNENSEEVTFE